MVKTRNVHSLLLFSDVKTDAIHSHTDIKCLTNPNYSLIVLTAVNFHYLLFVVYTNVSFFITFITCQFSTKTSFYKVEKNLVHLYNKRIHGVYSFVLRA